jgi:hypothetical protein
MFERIYIHIVARFLGVDGAMISPKIFNDTLPPIIPVQSEPGILALSLDAAILSVGQTC